MEEGSKAGASVEIKTSTIGAAAKIPHLSYIGDAEIGAGANLGAGTITCNYDGVHKHRTIVGDGAFVGSDTMLVAPVEIGGGAVIGAGSTISHNVPPAALAIERSEQRVIEGWAARRREARRREAWQDDECRSDAHDDLHTGQTHDGVRRNAQPGPLGGHRPASGRRAREHQDLEVRQW
jgi:serine acetyltransferase